MFRKFLFVVCSLALISCAKEEVNPETPQMGHPKDLEVVCPLKGTVLSSEGFLDIQSEMSYNSGFLTLKEESVEGYGVLYSTEYAYEKAGILTYITESSTMGTRVAQTRMAYDDEDRLVSITSSVYDVPVRKKIQSDLESKIRKFNSRIAKLHGARVGQETDDIEILFEYNEAEAYPNRVISKSSSFGVDIVLDLELEYENGNAVRISGMQIYEGLSIPMEIKYSYDDKPLYLASFPFALRFQRSYFCRNNPLMSETYYSGVLIEKEEFSYKYNELGLVESAEKIYTVYDQTGAASDTSIEGMTMEYDCQ